MLKKIATVLTGATSGLVPNLTMAQDMKVHVPAEFDDQEYLLIAWPRWVFSPQHSVEDVVLQMISALCSGDTRQESGHTKIVIQVPEDLYDDCFDSITAAKLESCVAHYDKSNRDDLWIRDMGPAFAKEGDQLVGLDFQFDLWSAPALGTAEVVYTENEAAKAMLQRAGVTNVHHSFLIGEGGNREFNGKGTLLMNRNVEILRNVKEAWSIEDSEEEYKLIFGVSNIVWVDGVPSNDRIAVEPLSVNISDTQHYLFNWGTGGHIDEVARFVNPTTIVVASITEEEVSEDTTGLAAADKAILDDVYRTLQEARDQDGNHFELIKLPSPPSKIDTLTEKSDLYYWYEPLPEFQSTLAAGKDLKTIAASSYMNFVITNNVVLAPQYFNADDSIFGTDAVLSADAEVIKKLTAAFPYRKVVGINALAVNMGGGGMHCITAHQFA